MSNILTKLQNCGKTLEGTVYISLPNSKLQGVTSNKKFTLLFLNDDGMCCNLRQTKTSQQ